jgi:predicted AlkP superfamily phosphohydrolase/phosphomutase
MDNSSAALASGMERAPSGRTLVVALDSMDLLLVQKWAAEGHLPYLNELLESCPLVRMTALSRVLQGAKWLSTATGVSPGHYGLYHQSQIRNGSYEIGQFHADHVKPDFFYQVLDDAGVRCTIIDFPGDRPRQLSHGRQVVDWGSEFSYWHFETQPAELRQQILQDIGTHPFTNYGHTQEGEEGARQLRKKLERGIELKTRLGQYFMDRKDWDFLFINSSEGHKAGHWLWRFWDTQYPDFVETDVYLRDGLREIYRGLDQELEALASRLGPNDNLIVMSDHGMMAGYRGQHMIEDILVRLGFLVRPGDGKAGKSDQTLSGQGKSMERRVMHRAWRIRKFIKSSIPEFAKHFLHKMLGENTKPDWSRTKVFSLPTDRNSYLRVNLRGREPQGIVEPGQEYEQLLDTLETELRALINVDTGEPAVEEVFRLRELYPGPQVDDLPDISVLWRSEVPINAVTSPAIGTLRIKASESRSGNHRPEGFLLAKGPAFKKGAISLYGDILQVAPTLLRLHGLSAPSHYEMGPINEIFTADAMQAEEQ